jgi:hypothetical protein
VKIPTTTLIGRVCESSMLFGCYCNGGLYNKQCWHVFTIIHPISKQQFSIPTSVWTQVLLFNCKILLHFFVVRYLLCMNQLWVEHQFTWKYKCEDIYKSFAPINILFQWHLSFEFWNFFMFCLWTTNVTKMSISS